MLINDKSETAWPSQANLVQRIAAFVREDRVSAFKIGITNDPFIRSRHYNGVYDEMIVSYETRSEEFERQAERDMTEYFKVSCDNRRMGGAGRGGEPPYYLYIVCKASVSIAPNNRLRLTIGMASEAVRSTSGMEFPG